MYKNQRPWAMLTNTARKGTHSILVSGDVSGWPVGGKIAMASTDYDGNQAETRVIIKLTKGSPLLYFDFSLAIVFI